MLLPRRLLTGHDSLASARILSAGVAFCQLLEKQTWRALLPWLAGQVFGPHCRENGTLSKSDLFYAPSLSTTKSPEVLCLQSLNEWQYGSKDETLLRT
jgi:hypothetical protein